MESRTMRNTEATIREFVNCFKAEVIHVFYSDQYDRDSAEYILQELLNNAFEHGNLRDETKTITIVWEVRSGELELKIQDQGEGFLPRIPDQCPALGEPRGRGLWSIKMDEHVSALAFSEGGCAVTVIFLAKEQNNGN